MSGPASNPNLRTSVISEMGAALERLRASMPEANGEQALRLCVGYFATLYSRHFGHLEAVGMLTEMARRGVGQALVDHTATRN